MEAAATANGAADDKVAVLRETTPFGEVSAASLARIAALARTARYAAGERIYSAGDSADDIFVVVSGRADHVFKPEVAREPLKRVTRGGVFGWAGLLLGQPVDRGGAGRAALQPAGGRCGVRLGGQRPRLLQRW